jgi:hypothetical protein
VLPSGTNSHGVQEVEDIEEQPMKRWWYTDVNPKWGREVQMTKMREKRSEQRHQNNRSDKKK